MKRKEREREREMYIVKYEVRRVKIMAEAV